MKIIRNKEILNRQSSNIVQNELSNIAMVLQNQLVMVDYYSIDALSSETIAGFKDVYDFISPDSTIRYNLIKSMPIAGIDNLLTLSDFDEEMGEIVDFTATGMIFPNTVKPKAGDFFTILAATTPALYQITKVSTNTMKDMPCYEIDITLKSQELEKITQLNNQIKDRYQFVVSSIGADKNLVMKEETYFDLKDHIDNYLDLSDAYKSLFYDYSRSTFMYKDLLDANVKTHIIDIMLLKFLYENGIIVYDEVVTFANNNYSKDIERVFIDTPPIIDNHTYNISVFNRFIQKKSDKMDFAEYRYCDLNILSPQISKFEGVNIKYSESYVKISEDSFALQFNIFDDDFVTHIKNNTKYIEGDNVNVSLRNALISYYNNEEVVFDNVEISYEKSIENFYLIPILLYMYKVYITSLK